MKKTISRREFFSIGLKTLGGLVLIGDMPLIKGCSSAIFEPFTIDEFVNHPNVKEFLGNLNSVGLQFLIYKENNPPNISGNYDISGGTTISYYNNDWRDFKMLAPGKFIFKNQTPENRIDFDFSQLLPRNQTSNDAVSELIRGKDNKFTVYSETLITTLYDNKECRANTIFMISGEKKENWDIEGKFISVPIKNLDESVCIHVHTYGDYKFARKLTDEDIYALIDKYDGEDREFYRVIVKIESAGDQNAISGVGARGLMQIMPGAWKDMTNYTYESAFNPDKNVEIGIKYYEWIENWLSSRVPNWNSKERLEQYKLMGAAYDWGIGNLKNANWDITNAPLETRNYVRKIEEYLSR